MKALGTGHSQGVLWRDIEVVRRGGPPQLQFHGGAGAPVRRDGRPIVAPDHHALRRARDGAGAAPRRLTATPVDVSRAATAPSARRSPRPRNLQSPQSAFAQHA